MQNILYLILRLISAVCRWWIRPQFSPFLIALLIASDAYFESLA